MLVILNKTSVIKETTDYISDNISVVEDETMTDLKSLNFHSFIGFNKGIASKILSAGSLFFKFFKFKNSDNSVSYQFSIPYSRKTSFIFDYLKTLGITLSELNIEFKKNKEVFVMKVHNKILKVLTVSSEEVSTDLTYYLYCLCKMFIVLGTSSEICAVSGSESVESTDKKCIISKKLLDSLYKAFNNMADTVTVEVMADNATDSYKEVSYYINHIDSEFETKYNSCTDYVYNTLEIDDKHPCYLTIYNKAFNELYIIDTNSNTIYTNNVLFKYNTLNFDEWIPALVTVLSKLNTCNTINVVYVKSDELFSKKVFGDDVKDIIVSVDVKGFEKVFTNLNINYAENYNMKIYEKMCKDVNLKAESSGIDLTEEYKSDEYAQQLYKQYQDYYSTFDLKDLTNTVKGFALGDIYSMIFIGESGTGKSTAAKVIPYKCNMPYIVINCSTNIEESDMFGSMIPNPNKVNAEDPEFIWEDGILTKAIRNGYCAVIEEINFARPGVLGKLNSLLDESRQIDLSNGEIVKAHKNFRIIVTCNVAYEGTNRLNKALINRFEVCKQFTDLERNEAIEVIRNRTGYTDIAKINAVYDVYEAIKKYSDEQSLNIVISIRQLLNLFKQGKYYKTAADAVNNTLINAAFLEDADHKTYFKKTVLPAFELKFKI